MAIRPLTDHEFRYKVVGGEFTEWVGCSTGNTTDNEDGTYTINNINYNIAEGDFQVRVKAIDGNPPSDIISNDIAFTIETIDADAQTYLDAAGIVADEILYADEVPLPSNNVITGINYLFTELKAQSLFSKMRYFYPYFGGTDEQRRLNAINPGVKTLSRIGTPDSPFNYLGVAFNGSSALDSVVKTTDFDADDITFGIYITGGGAGGFDAGAFDGNGFVIYADGGCFMNGGNNATGNEPGMRGLAMMSISTPTRGTFFVNKDLKFDTTTPNSAVVDLSLYFGGLNSGYFSPKTMGLGFIGYGMDDADVLVFADIIENYMQYVRRGKKKIFSFFGDSITVAQGATETYLGWVDVLCGLQLVNPNNQGVGGSTIATLCSDLAGNILPKTQYDQKIFFSYSTNETTAEMQIEDYKTYYRQAIDFAIDQGYTVDDICIGLGYLFPSIDQSYQDDLIQAGVDIADEYSIDRRLNLKTIMIANGNLDLINVSDGHPNDLGHSLIADAWNELLNSF